MHFRSFAGFAFVMLMLVGCLARCEFACEFDSVCDSIMITRPADVMHLSERVFPSFVFVSCRVASLSLVPPFLLFVPLCAGEVPIDPCPWFLLCCPPCFLLCFFSVFTCVSSLFSLGSCSLSLPPARVSQDSGQPLLRHHCLRTALLIH